jgi:hypothetical protein
MVIKLVNCSIFEVSLFFILIELVLKYQQNQCQNDFLINLKTNGLIIMNFLIKIFSSKNKLRILINFCRLKKIGPKIMQLLLCCTNN